MFYDTKNTLFTDLCTLAIYCIYFCSSTYDYVTIYVLESSQMLGYPNTKTIQMIFQICPSTT